MNALVYSILFPLIGFIILSFSQNQFSYIKTTILGMGSIILSSICIIFSFYDFYLKNKKFCYYFSTYYSINLFNFINIKNFYIPFTLYVDGLSFIFLFNIIIVSLCIYLYSTWYMKKQEGYSRFFAYLNLFITNMIVLILADNFLTMYIGWEGVGFCSYLMIGFYYSKFNNILSSFKSFIITRIGDIFLLFAIFILYKIFGTLNIHDINNLIYNKNYSEIYCININICSMMLLLSAISKSAQIPLQMWLTTAMVGPTPGSALIHASTMVTAGLYLIIRSYNIFLITPKILNLIGWIGATTIILGSISAVFQNHLKKILAYSTISQIGYMFLAIGIKKYDAAIFHMITHSFFKALLFLSAGSIIYYSNNEQNIFKIQTIKKTLSLINYSFIIGCISLASIPFINSGFYSKEYILFSTIEKKQYLFTLIILFGIFITSIYTFRMIFTIFSNFSIKHNNIQHYTNNLSHNISLYILIILSTLGGICKSLLNLLSPLSNNIEKNIYLINNNYHISNKILTFFISSIISLLGCFISYIFWFEKKSFKKKKNYFQKFFYYKKYFILFNITEWGLLLIYNNIFIKPYFYIGSLIKFDPLNYLIKTPILMLLYFKKNFYMIFNIKKLNHHINYFITSSIIVLSLILFIYGINYNYNLIKL